MSLGEPYSKAPVQEAIIDFRWRKSIEQSAVEKIARKLADAYPISEAQHSTDVMVDTASGTANFQVRNAQVGIHLSHADRDRALMIQHGGLVVAKLAPYTHWGDLKSRAAEALECAKAVVRGTEIARIGIRFINRIDIPLPGGGAGLTLSDYVLVYPHIPFFSAQPMMAFNLFAARKSEDERWTANISSGLVQSPLVNHLSVILDIDVYREEQISIRDDALWDVAEEGRQLKNKIFERCVTDRARRLFS